MANYENVKYLSLPQQVRQNQLQIEKLLTMYSLVYTTLVAIQNRTYLTKAELIETNRDPIVGDLVYGSDSYYAQIIRVGEGIVELTVIGQIANVQPLYELLNLKADLTYVNSQLALTAKLAVSNVFTQPQQVPNATLPQHTTNLNQVETMFEMFKQQFRGYNLASPDLTGKESLGNGVYKLNASTNYDILYNVYSGTYTINGDIPQYFILLNFVNNDFVNNDIHLYVNYLGGTTSHSIEISSSNPYNFINFMSIDDISRNINITANDIRFLTTNNTTFNNYQFKLKIEKGTQATPYTVPGEIPQYKIVGEE